jgi:hypothetical protein
MDVCGVGTQHLHEIPFRAVRDRNDRGCTVDAALKSRKEELLIPAIELRESKRYEIVRDHDGRGASEDRGDVDRGEE